jgi:cytidine deaminase
MAEATKLDMRRPKRALYQDLVDVALQHAPFAYPPLSDYRVGAAALLWDGRVYLGTNTENPGLGLTIHGEMSCINAAITDGALNQALEAGLTAQNFIRALSIIPLRSYEAWACGHCRDFMAGFGLTMDIVVRKTDNSPIWKPLRRLLPYADDPTVRVEDARSGRLLTVQSHGKGVGCGGGLSVQVGGDFSHVAGGCKAPLPGLAGGTLLDDIPTTWSKAKAHARLLQLAREAATKSFAPYSKRRAGAAVWLHDGSVFTGTRVENVGYTLSSDPEQVALNAAVNSGALEAAVKRGVMPTEFVRAIAYSVPGRPMAFPSGSSRQCMCDFGLNIDIVADGTDGKPFHRTLGQLLPHAFVPDVLSYWTR